MKDPDWLAWARELQAIAQTGLTFCRDPYDRERYEAIRQPAALIGGRATTSHETSEVGWFHEADIPADLSLERVLPQQIRRMFAHRRDPSMPTDFD